MIPTISFPGVAKLAFLIGDAVKHVANKVNFANAFRHVAQVGGQAPSAPRLERLHSREEGRTALTLRSGVDPSLEQRRNSLDSRERAVAERRSSRQGTPAPSQGKDVQRHTARALRDLQDELASTAQLFDGSQRGDAARRIGAAVERVRKECGPDEALRIASQGIQAVRSAPAKLVGPPRTHRLI